MHEIVIPRIRSRHKRKLREMAPEKGEGSGTQRAEGAQGGQGGQVLRVILEVDMGYAKSVLGILKILQFVS